MQKIHTAIIFFMVLQLTMGCKHADNKSAKAESAEINLSEQSSMDSVIENNRYIALTYPLPYTSDIVNSFPKEDTNETPLIIIPPGTFEADSSLLYVMQKYTHRKIERLSSYYGTELKVITTKHLYYDVFQERIGTNKVLFFEDIKQSARQKLQFTYLFTKDNKWPPDTCSVLVTSSQN